MNQKYVVLMKTEDIFEGPLKLTVYSDCRMMSLLMGTSAHFVLFSKFLRMSSFQQKHTYTEILTL